MVIDNSQAQLIKMSTKAPPLHQNKIDFVRRNKEMIRKRSLKNKESKDSNGEVLKEKKNRIPNPSRVSSTNKPIKKSENLPRRVLTNKNLNRDTKRTCMPRRITAFPVDKKKTSLKEKTLLKPRDNQCGTPMQKMRKKLVRRSISCKVNSMKRENCDQLLKRKSNLSKIKKQEELENKLNNWLISKGKQPKAKALKGFKPAKVILTPKQSPASKTTSCWQGLRDEESCDEVVVLLRHMNEDLQNCIARNTDFREVKEILTNLSQEHPTVKNYSQYWIMFLQILESNNSPCEEAVEIFEEAIKNNAQPIADVQQRLKEYLENHSKVQNTTETTSTDKENVSTDNASAGLHESPAIKSVSTSPFIFPTTPFVIKNKPNYTVSPLAVSQMPESTPSSVVKLKIISQSSPIFKRMMERRLISTDTSAIVTPVRRSCRIALSSHKKTKMTVSQNNMCLSTISDVVSAIQDEQHEKCEILFQPNNAFENECRDICTALEF